MRAFHNDVKVKRRYLGRVKAHEKADEIVKGHYWQNGKGCAVGCTIHSGDHGAYESELGIPTILARLEDIIFENLPNDLAKTWPRRFLQAVRPGADLSLVWAKFAVWMLTDEKYGVLQYSRTEKTTEAIQSVADLFTLQTAGAEVGQEDFLEAKRAAYDADADADAAAADADADADAAAYAAYNAAAAAAADAAAAAAYAADAAADAAAYAAADAAALTQVPIAQSEKLLELLREA